ncbi:MAG: hypothetical protein ACKOYM_01685 [Actinomycetes bacterium]
MGSPIPKDEYRHTAEPSVPLWNESYYFDFFAPDLSVGGYVRLGLVPGEGVAWYWACLVGPNRPLVVVTDHTVPLPSSAGSLEVRSDGLWADHAVETPLDHFSINLEAFALALDDPVQMYGSPRGDRVPFGFELDFVTDRAAYLWPPVTPRYEVPCSVEGVVLVGDERIEFSGWGQRDHSWGAPRDWWATSWCWTAGRLDDGTRWHTAGAFAPDVDWGVAYRLDAHSAEFVEGDSVLVEVTQGPDALPTATRIEAVDLALEFEPVAFCPVLLESTDGRTSKFPRALARVSTTDGRAGAAWIEWNQPQSR